MQKKEKKAVIMERKPCFPPKIEKSAFMLSTLWYYLPTDPFCLLIY